MPRFDALVVGTSGKGKLRSGNKALGSWFQFCDTVL